MNAANLNSELVEQVIAARTVTASTTATTAAQTTQIGVVEALKAKYVSLGAVIKAHPVIAGITAAVAVIGTAIVIIDKYNLSVKEAREQLDKLNSEIDEIHNTFSSTEKTVSGISKRFAELSQGVDQLSGKNLTLNTEDYQEFLSLSNQLADLFPTLSRNYDENGNAIVQLSGDVDTIVGSLTNLVDAQRQLANQEIAEKLPETYKATKKSTQGYADEIEVLENQRDLYKRVLEDLHNLSSWEELENSQGQVKPEYFFLREKISHDGQNDLINNGSVQDAVRYYEQQLSSANSSLTTITNKYSGEWSKLNQSLFAWLYTDANYSVLSDNLQAGIQTVINTIDWNELNYKDIDEVKNHILTNLIEPIRDNEEVHDLFVKLFELKPGDLDRVEIAQQLQNILNGLNIEFNVMPVVANEADTKRRLLNSIYAISGIDNKATNTSEYMMSKVDIQNMEEYTKDFTETQVEQWLKVTAGATSAKEAIEAYEKSIANPKVETKFEITPEDEKALSDYQSKIDSISSSLADLHNLKASDITSLLTDFSAYADIWEQFGVNEYGEGDIEGALEAIAKKLKEETANKVPQMRSYIEGMYEAILNPKGDSDKLQLEVDSLELILKDVRDGKVLDESATAKLINKYPELADAVKIVAEGYSFEEEAIKSLTNSKITEANESIAWEIEQTEQAIANVRARIRARQLELIQLKDQGKQMALLDENGEVQFVEPNLKAEKYDKELQGLLEHLKELKETWNENIEAINKNKELEEAAKKFATIRDILETELNGSISDNRRLEIYTALETAIADDYNAQIELAKAEGDTLAIEKLELEKKQALVDLDQQRIDLARELDDAEISRLERTRTELQNQIDLNGGKGTAEQYRELIRYQKEIAEERAADLEREKKLLLEIELNIGKNSDAYREQEQKVNDIEDALADCTKEIKNMNKEILNIALDALDDAIDDLNDELKSTEKEMEEIEKISEIMQNYYERQIREQEKLKDAVQDEIDALNKANDERKRALDLQKAQYDLERAHNQRVKKVYKGEGQGFVYEVDQDAVRDAQETISDLEHEKTIAKLEEKIERYDKIIESLEKKKEEWANTTSLTDEEIDDFIDSMGGEDNLLGKEDGLLTDSKKNYSDANQFKENIQDAAEYLEEMKERVADYVDAYEWGERSFSDTLGLISADVKTYTDKLTENLELSEEEATLKWSNMVTSILDKFGIMEEAIEAGWKSLTDSAGTAGEDIGEGSAPDQQPTQDAVDDIKDIVHDGNESNKKDTENANGDMKKDSEKTFEEIATELKTAISEQKTALETFKTEVQTLFGDVYNAVNDGLLEGLNAFSGKVSESCSFLSEQVSALETKLNDTEKAVDELTEKETKISTSKGGGRTTDVVAIQKFHTGLEKGLVGEKQSGEGLKKVALRKLEPDEVPAVLKVNEAVLTQLQQQNVMSNIGTAFRAGVNTSVIKNNSSTPVVQNINLTLPNVTNESGYNRLVQELQGLQLDALQFAKRR